MGVGEEQRDVDRGLVTDVYIEKFALFLDCFLELSIQRYVRGLAGNFHVTDVIYRPSFLPGRGLQSPLASGMDIALVLLAASALIGATAGLRLKAIVLAPIALLIVIVSAAVLRMHGFGSVSGIVIVVACLVLNQAAYLLVELLDLKSGVSCLSLDDVTDGEPGPGRKQTVDDDHGDQKPPPSRPFYPPEN
jgi:hypothetical protein